MLQFIEVQIFVIWIPPKMTILHLHKQSPIIPYLSRSLPFDLIFQPIKKTLCLRARTALTTCVIKVVLYRILAAWIVVSILEVYSEACVRVT